MTHLTGIDPRGPRFAATITSVLLLIALVLTLIGVSPTASTAGIAARVADPGFVLLVVIALLFLWGVVSPRTAPWGAIFRRFVRPGLSAPTELEDPRPPRFAQGVGLLVVAIGILLHVIGVPWALPVAAGAAFIAAFLNAAFSFCLGCQIYLLLQRAGVIGRTTPIA